LVSVEFSIQPRFYEYNSVFIGFSMRISIGIGDSDSVEDAVGFRALWTHGLNVHVCVKLAFGHPSCEHSQ